MARKVGVIRDGVDVRRCTQCNRVLTSKNKQFRPACVHVVGTGDSGVVWEDGAIVVKAYGRNGRRPLCINCSCGPALVRLY